MPGNRDAVRRRWEDNIDQPRRFRCAVLDEREFDEAVERARSYLAGREPLLPTGLPRCGVVDGHGDLIADDVFCLDNGPRVLDCLGFDDTLRQLDALDDVAFLGIDLAAQMITQSTTPGCGDPATPGRSHARQVAELIAARYPDRTVHVVGDAAYVRERVREVDVGSAGPAGVKVTSVLHELPPHRTLRAAPHPRRPNRARDSGPRRQTADS
jgi:hypothetical protein